jgi:HlyD family secretion protein
MSRMRSRWWWAVGAFSVVGLGVFWRLGPPDVPAVVVQAGPLQQKLLFSARVTHPQRVEIGATLTGRVAQVAVAEGVQVKAGQPLLRLEDSELQAALAQAQAAERQAAARVKGLRGSGRSAAAAGTAQAEAVLRAADAEHRRTQDLVGRGFLSAARLDEALRALNVAQAQLVAAQAQVSALAEQGTDITQAQAQWAVAQAATQAAVARLAQAQLRAPADGRVLSRNVEPGQIVQPGRALLTLALAGATQLEAAVDERYLQQLRPGQAATGRADAFPNDRFKAQVLSIAPLVDAQRGSVVVKLAVAEPPGFLREDMSLTVEVLTATRDRALAVPLAALRSEEGTRATVWVVAGGRVEARTVQLGLRTLEAAEVQSGLNAGDMVLLAATRAPGASVKADLAAGAALRAQGAGEDAATGLSNAMGR